MKSLVNSSKFMFISLILACVSVVAWAQEKKVDVDINVGKENESRQWYMSPVFWIIGGAVFILLLVALLRGRSKD